MSRPTLALAQKWMREVHNIYISVVFNDSVASEYYYFIHTNVSKPYSNRVCSLPFKTNVYEEALEEGLKQACLIVKERL